MGLCGAERAARAVAGPEQDVAADIYALRPAEAHPRAHPLAQRRLAAAGAAAHQLLGPNIKATRGGKMALACLLVDAHMLMSAAVCAFDSRVLLTGALQRLQCAKAWRVYSPLA